MSRHRRNTSSPPSSPDRAEESPPPAKRRRVLSITEADLSYEPSGNERSRSSRVNGMLSAFPELADDAEGDARGEAWEYLRSVRSEASLLPDILGPASKPRLQLPSGNGELDYGHDTNGDDLHDHQVLPNVEPFDDAFFDDDEAVVAAPIANGDGRRSSDYSDAQAAYYRALIRRFTNLQSFLRHAPPVEAISTLSSKYPISLPWGSERAKQQWREILVGKEPVMVQLGCMDMETVLELIKLSKIRLAGVVRVEKLDKVKVLGAWIWGLLAKMEVERLGSEEVAEVRELGKRAVDLLSQRRHEKPGSYRDEDEHEQEIIEGGGVDNEVEEGEIEELEMAKARLQEQLAEGQTTVDSNKVNGQKSPTNSDSDKQIRMMLDMVMTVVGDCYGQRDLLDFRDIWGAA